VTTICQQRGRYQLGPIRLRTSDPFGLFPMQRDLTPTSNVVIYPLTFPIHQFALPLGILPGGDALRRRTHTSPPTPPACATMSRATASAASTGAARPAATGWW
jgi:hypothetical protein